MAFCFRDRSARNGHDGAWPCPEDPATPLFDAKMIGLFEFAKRFAKRSASRVFV